MSSERTTVDLHLHYYPDKISRYQEANPESLDPETERLIGKIAGSDVKFVGILGRTVAGTSEIINQIRKRLETHGVKAIFGMEYHSLLPENLRHLTQNGFVDLVCFDFDHDSPVIQEEFGLNSTKLNARIVKEYLEKLNQLGFNLTPQTDQQNDSLKRLKEGQVANKADLLTLLILELSNQNKDAITSLEQRYGPITDVDKRNNGFTPKKNWLYRLLFKPPSGLASFYFQKQPDLLTKLIHEANGIVLYSPEEKFSPEIMNYLLSLGIDGVMGWHGGKLEDLPTSWIKTLRKAGKLILGGSDFDPVKDDWQPGVGKGTMYLSNRRGKELTKYLKKKKT